MKFNHRLISILSSKTGNKDDKNGNNREYENRGYRTL